MKRFVPFAPLLLAACAVVPRSAGPQELFWERLWALCGRAYEGHVASTDPADREMAAMRLVIHVRQCTPEAIRVGFFVGDNGSRTWVISRTPTGLSLTHVHRTRGGAEEARSHYGGDTLSPGTARRQTFPANAATRALFQREDIAEAANNIWSIEIAPRQMLGYAVDREARHLRIEFDLSRPVPAPGPGWGER